MLEKSRCTLLAQLEMKNEEVMRKWEGKLLSMGSVSSIQKENVIFPPTLVLLWLEACVSSLKAVCLLPNHCIIASQLSKLWNGRSVNFSLSFVLTIMSWKWIWFSYYFSAWFYPQKFWHSVWKIMKIYQQKFVFNVMQNIGIQTHCKKISNYVQKFNFQKKMIKLWILIFVPKVN